MIFSDIVALAKAGWTPKDIKEIIEIVETSPKAKETETKPESTDNNDNNDSDLNAFEKLVNEANTKGE